MTLTLSEIMKGLSQNEYERLLSSLAGAIQTRRNNIKIVSAERLNAVSTRYTVKRNGTYYPYLVEEIFKPYGKNLYLNLGFII